MTNPYEPIEHDVIRIEQEARRGRSEFVAHCLRSALGWLTGLLPMGRTTARG